MIELSTTKTQNILNKANQKLNFTYNLNSDKNRYIVSIKNIYTGKNPSLDFELIKRIEKYVKTGYYSSIGGWLDKKTNVYYLDANIHLQMLHYALQLAKNNNQIAIFDTKKQETIYLNNYNI